MLRGVEFLLVQIAVDIMLAAHKLTPGQQRRANKIQWISLQILQGINETYPSCFCINVDNCWLRNLQHRTSCSRFWYLCCVASGGSISQWKRATSGRGSCRGEHQMFDFREDHEVVVYNWKPRSVYLWKLPEGYCYIFVCVVKIIGKLSNMKKLF